MRDLSDEQLLNLYVRDGNEAAFSQIVGRHLDGVYAAARRQVRDSHLAEDVTQAVFIVLVRRAGSIRKGSSLPGWLLKVTWYVSRDAIRSKTRRFRHENEVAVMNELTAQRAEAAKAWQEIAPVLDDAMSGLSEADRGVLMLRFLEDKSVEEASRILGASEAAVTKRISRALARLRKLLARRGVAVPQALLGGALAGGAAHAAPAALTAATMHASLAGAVAASNAAVLAKGAVTTLTVAKIHTAVVATLVFLLVVPASVLVVRHVLLAEPVAESSPPVSPAAPFTPTSTQTDATTYLQSATLQPNQVLIHIAPPFLPGRDELIRKFAGNGNTSSTALILRYEKGKPRISVMFAGSINFSNLLQFTVKLRSQEIEDSADLLSVEAIPGDYVFNPGATPEQLVLAMHDVVHDQFGKSVLFSFHDVLRKVIVLGGKWQYAPLNPQKYRPAGRTQHLEIYGEALNPKTPINAKGPSDYLAQELSVWINRQVLIDATGLPAKLEWHINGELPGADVSKAHDQTLNLNHLCEQTGLSWAEETRIVRRLFIDPSPTDPISQYYTLKNGEILRRVTGVPISARKAYFQSINSIREMGRIPRAIVAFPDTHWNWNWDGPFTLEDLIENVLDTYPQEIEGNSEDVVMPGDYLCSNDSTFEQRRFMLEKILHDELHDKRTLAFRQVERNVIVLRGDWNYKTIPSPRQKESKIPSIEIYNRKLAKNPASMSICDSRRFAGELGRWLGKQIVIEADQFPREICAMFNDPLNQHPADFGEVLKHLTEQTGLTWSQENRKVPRLFIAESP
jgi:RNA polymerase sigma factor (sigma-70 family)